MKTWKEYAAHFQWTEHYETMFDRPLDEMRKGKAVPLSQSEWRQKLRPNNSIRKLASNIENYSITFLDSLKDDVYIGLR